MQRNIDVSGPVEMVAQNETPKLSSPCREAAIYRRLRGCRGGGSRALFQLSPLYTTPVWHENARSRASFLPMPRGSGLLKPV